ISPLLESYMERRNTYIFGQDKDNLVVSEDSPKPISVMTPIIGGGDVMGAVMLMGTDKMSAPSQTDIKLTQVAAGFLGKQMEE
ncbi:MAG: stage V sporulation protein T, partial [Clostridia bacterium]|nr:stage V sporulation protein T [Clostridia bacterium]